MTLPIDTPYQTPKEALDGLTALEQQFIERHDRRGVFTSAYRLITAELMRRSQDAFFEDNVWLERCIVEFAELYRMALVAYEAGQMDQVPKAWRVSFDAALDGTSVIIQDLILGINAHINHDLPLALYQVGIDPDRDRCYRDHTAVNNALRETTDVVQERIGEIYAPALSFLDLVGGDADEVLTNFSFGKARDAAWLFGTVLTDAADEPARAEVRRRLNDQSAVLARLILRPNGDYPWLFEALHRLDAMLPHWRMPFLDGETEPAQQVGPAIEKVVDNFDEVIVRLETLVEQFDARRSRLSVYPTIYLDVTQRIKQAVAAGHFEDPAWLTQLDLLFASQYLTAIERWQSGEHDKLPQCWRTALEAAEAGETVVLQDVILAINARLNHDLGIALFQAGVHEGESERRIRDYHRIHDIFAGAINSVQSILAGKYSRVLGLLDEVAHGLDELVTDFLYTQARDTALDNAFALARAGSTAERTALLQQFDRRATKLAQKILLRPIVGGGWVIHALRRVEAAYAGAWSQWTMSPPALTLYQRLLAEQFAKLPPVLQDFHGTVSGGRAAGHVQVIRGRGVFHRLLGRLLGLPPAGERVPVRLQVVVKGEREQWFRVFEGERVVSLNAVQYAEETPDCRLLVESFGPMRLLFQPVVEEDGLVFEQVGCRLGAIRLPRPVAPQAGAELRGRAEDWHIDVRMALPLMGLLLRYRGTVAAV